MAFVIPIVVIGTQRQENECEPLSRPEIQI